MEMFKLLIVFFCVLLITGCGKSRTESYDLPEAIAKENTEQPQPILHAAFFDIAFVQANVLERQEMNGATITAQIDDRSYFFFDNDENNRDYIYTIESIIYTLLYFIPEALPIRILKINEEASSGAININAIQLDSNDFYATGLLTQAVSANRLPRWLSAGLEGMVRGHASAHTAINLSELQFSGCFHGSQTHGTAINMAARFVYYLYNNGQLIDIINLFWNDTEDSVNEAMRLSEKSYQAFFSHTLDTSMLIDFSGNVRVRYNRNFYAFMVIHDSVPLAIFCNL